jgi:hypothetical protein
MRESGKPTSDHCWRARLRACGGARSRRSRAALTHGLNTQRVSAVQKVWCVCATILLQHGPTLHLRDMGFFPSLADPCIWKRQVEDHCEHIAVHVDNFAIASKDPAEIIRFLTDKCNSNSRALVPSSFIWDATSFETKRASCASMSLLTCVNDEGHITVGERRPSRD